MNIIVSPPFWYICFWVGLASWVGVYFDRYPQYTPAFKIVGLVLIGAALLHSVGIIK